MPGSNNNTPTETNTNSPEISNAYVQHLARRIIQEDNKPPSPSGSAAENNLSAPPSPADDPALDNDNTDNVDLQAYEEYIRQQIELDRLKQQIQQQLPEHLSTEDVNEVAQRLLRTLEFNASEHNNAVGVPAFNSCASCGYDVPRLDNFCGCCGTRNCWDCSNCRRLNDYSHAFCGFCGTAQIHRANGEERIVGSVTSSVSLNSAQDDELPMSGDAQHFSSSNVIGADARSEDGYSFADDEEEDDDGEDEEMVPPNNNKDAWMCPICTYCNENPLFLTCEICSEPRPALEKLPQPESLKKPLTTAPPAGLDDELAEIYAHQERLLAEYQQGR